MAELAPAPEVGKSFRPLVCNDGTYGALASGYNRLNDRNAAFTRQREFSTWLQC
jgi:hypothetical protein